MDLFNGDSEKPGRNGIGFCAHNRNEELAVSFEIAYENHK